MKAPDFQIGNIELNSQEEELTITDLIELAKKLEKALQSGNTTTIEEAKANLSREVADMNALIIKLQALDQHDLADMLSRIYN